MIDALLFALNHSGVKADCEAWRYMQEGSSEWNFFGVQPWWENCAITLLAQYAIEGVVIILFLV